MVKKRIHFSILSLCVRGKVSTFAALASPIATASKPETAESINGGASWPSGGESEDDVVDSEQLTR